MPCIIGKNGIEKIVELPLNEAETALFAASEAAVAKTTGILKEHRQCNKQQHFIAD